MGCKSVDPLPARSTPFDSSRIAFFLDTAILGPFYFPVKGKVISPYGKRGQRMHTGTDIKLAHGDTVRAAFSGIVTKADLYYGYGILVILKHAQNLETYYSHLSKALVKSGDSIRYGTPLGLGGRTGRATTDHLHFELRKNGKPLNPELFFDFNGLNIKTLVLLKEAMPQESTKQSVASTFKKESQKDNPGNLSASKYHTIKKGDTLFSLSRRYGISVDEICKLNNIKKSGILKIGTKLRVK